MKIAIFLASETMNRLDKSFVQTVIFKIRDGLIVGVEKEYLSVKNINILTLWLVTKEIEELYVEEVEETVKAYFERINIKIKTFKEMKDNPILKAFII